MYDRSETSALLHVPLEWTAPRRRSRLPRLPWSLLVRQWRRGSVIDARLSEVRAHQTRCFDLRVGR